MEYNYDSSKDLTTLEGLYWFGCPGLLIYSVDIPGGTDQGHDCTVTISLTLLHQRHANIIHDQNLKKSETHHEIKSQRIEVLN